MMKKIFMFLAKRKLWKSAVRLSVLRKQNKKKKKKAVEKERKKKKKFLCVLHNKNIAAMNYRLSDRKISLIFFSLFEWTAKPQVDKRRNKTKRQH